MANMENLTIGDKVSISKVNRNVLPEESNEMYASKLIEIKSDNAIVITMPIYKNRIINLEQDGEYMLTFFTKTETYRAKGKVIQKYIDKSIKVAEIYILTELKHYQRRNYYRLACILEAAYRVITPMEEMLLKRISSNPNKEDEIYSMCRESLNQLQNYNLTATITDLSAGGIRFHSEDKHMIKDRLNFNFILSEGNRELFIEVNVRIIAASRVRVKPMNYEYRAIFDDITNDTREKIVRYVFDVQRSKRRRDKGND